MLRYIIRSLLGIFLGVCCAIYTWAKPFHFSLWPTTLYVGMDLVPLGYGWWWKTGRHYLLHGALDIGPLFLEADGGWGQLRRDNRNQHGALSDTRGHYFRGGVNYNFLTSTNYHNQFFIGFRYARSFFRVHLSSDKFSCRHPVVIDPPDSSATSSNPCDYYSGKNKYAHEVPQLSVKSWEDKGSACWWEIVAGGKVALLSVCSVGCTFRYKFNLKIEYASNSKDVHVKPFDILGFGLSKDDWAFGWSSYILLRIPLQRASEKPLVVEANLSKAHKVSTF